MWCGRENSSAVLGSARLSQTNKRDFFDFKSCGGQKKGKVLKKVAVGAPAKVCLGQNLDFVRRSVIPKSLKIEYMKGKNLQNIPKFCKKMAKFPDKSTPARHC